jgi:hypothetical protein
MENTENILTEVVSKKKRDFTTSFLRVTKFIAFISDWASSAGEIYKKHYGDSSKI